MILNISGNELLSKGENKQVSLDLINLRNALFSPSDYYYNIHRWRSVTISLRSALPLISNQKLELNFRRPPSETTAITRDFIIPLYFLANPVVDKIRINDNDNGHFVVETQDAQNILGTTIDTDLLERPVSPILNQGDNLSEVILAPSELAKWETNFKVRVIDDNQNLIEPTLTIVAIDENTNKITFDQAPSLANYNDKSLIFAPSNELTLKQLIDYKVN